MTNTNKTSRRALIDGDVICYQFAYSCKDWPLIHCLSEASEFIYDVMEKAGANCYTVFLSGKGNFRDRVAVTKPYKGNRKGKDKPLFHAPLRLLLSHDFDTVVSDDREADDDMATAQTTVLPPNCETIICTVDKDLMMVPGLHYNWRGTDGVVDVDEDTGNKAFFKQWLMGDTVDNIPGLAGVGKKTADTILEGRTTVADMLAAVMDAYSSRPFPECHKDYKAFAHEQARLLWMSRGDYPEYTDFINANKNNNNSKG